MDRCLQNLNGEGEVMYTIYVIFKCIPGKKEDYIESTTLGEFELK